jgi:hypothetical protein
VPSPKLHVQLAIRTSPPPDAVRLSETGAPACMRWPFPVEYPAATVSGGTGTMLTQNLRTMVAPAFVRNVAVAS